MRIDEEKCIKCGMCADNCGYHGITVVNTSGKTLFITNDNCRSCGECIGQCPAEAIYEQ